MEIGKKNSNQWRNGWTTLTFPLIAATACPLCATDCMCSPTPKPAGSKPCVNCAMTTSMPTTNSRNSKWPKWLIGIMQDSLEVGSHMPLCKRPSSHFLYIAFTAAIRAHGYHHSICISYELTHHNIVIKTDSKVSRLADNRLMRYFMYLTCLWIFTWPVLWACRKKFGHSTLKSEWRMAVTERQWYNDHVHEVLGQIRPSHRHVSGSIVI